MVSRRMEPAGNPSGAPTVRRTLAEVRRALTAAGVDARDAAFEAACLLEKHTGMDPARQLRDMERQVFCPAAFWEDVRRRAAGEPLQYILGEWEFMGLRFEVGPGVLIPRPDTETLVQTALDYFSGKLGRRPAGTDVLELCLGSGCVGIAAAKLCPDVRVTGIELSDAALAYARRNIERHGLQNRVAALKGDMLLPPPDGTPDFGALLCNPPYIRRDEIPTLDGTVRCYEPLSALDGGPDGLAFYRAAGPWLKRLRPGGLAAFEVGWMQAQEVSALLCAAGLSDVFVREDCAGIGRVAAGFAS